MKIERNKVLGSTSAGQGGLRHYWPGRDDDDGDVDYEALFRSFMEKLFANRGAFKVDGSLLFEFLPKAYVKNEQLISVETAFCFHQFEEDGYKDVVANKNGNTDVGSNNSSAISSYLYHKKAPPTGVSLEEFMPMI